MAISLNHRDLLELDLHAPLLDEFMRSRELYAHLLGIGKRMQAGYISRAPADTGALKQTAQVNMRRSKMRDRRWEMEFTVGNSRVDYADDIERRDHPLGETLRAMGFGDVVI